MKIKLFWNVLNISLCGLLKPGGDQTYLIWWLKVWREAWTERTRAARLTCISQMCFSVWIKKPVAFRLFSFAPPSTTTHSTSSFALWHSCPPSFNQTFSAMHVFFPAVVVLRTVKCSPVVAYYLLLSLLFLSFSVFLSEISVLFDS